MTDIVTEDTKELAELSVAFLIRRVDQQDNTIAALAARLRDAEAKIQALEEQSDE